MTFPPIPEFIFDDLAQVEQIIRERLEPQSAVLRTARQHLFGAGDKRLRPALTLLCAQLGNYSLERVLHAAAAVELIHLASRVHDDLIDEAERRRGTPTTYNRWSGNVALMVGDYLFALAASEMALAPDPRIIAYFSQGVMTICEGELAPVTTVTPAQTAIDQYLYKIGCKTAALFEAGSKAGVVCGGGAQHEIDLAGRYGYDLGMATQIMEDVFDVAGAPQQPDTLAGGGLRAGVITLPLIYAVADGADPRLAAVIEQEQPDEATIAWACGEIRRVGGDQRARADAQTFAQRAVTRLDGFPPSRARSALTELAVFIGQLDGRV
ncbi:MAG: polyprenyl synthetase family protein [Roseiflexaceae bacterium]|nr:polyprenyl synthetase family protein [Roseiflexaceae bacterium]